VSNILRLNELDNVGICKVALPAGTQLITSDIRLATDVPALHKVALRDIAAGEAILKYGQTMGSCTQLCDG
jgi:altronate hydrolase